MWNLEVSWLYSFFKLWRPRFASTRRKTSFSRRATSRSKLPSERIVIEVCSVGLPSLAALIRRTWARVSWAGEPSSR